MSRMCNAVRGLLGVAAAAVVAVGSARGDDKKDKEYALPGVKVGAVELDCKLTHKATGEVCASGEITGEVLKQKVSGKLVGVELCGKKLDGGLKISGKAEAGEVPNAQGKTVKAVEAEVEVQWADDKVTKGRAKVVVATGGAKPETAYFTYDGKGFKKVEEKEYNEVNCDKVDTKK